jgi:uncharacterized protein YeaO (DUF488 family)
VGKRNAEEFRWDYDQTQKDLRGGRAELNSKTHLLQKLIADAANRDITLVYASREQRCNNVTVLREVIDELLAHENRA